MVVVENTAYPIAPLAQENYNPRNRQDRGDIAYDLVQNGLEVRRFTETELQLISHIYAQELKRGGKFANV